MTEFRVRAYSSVSDEWFAIDVPAEVVPRIEAIVASGITVYGPDYSRPCVETLRDLNRAWEHAPDYAEERLVYCESKIPKRGLPIGARVRHDGRRWSTDAFATVQQVKPQHDGTFEYEVLVDEDSHWPSAGKLTWWASYHTIHVQGAP